MLIPFGCTGNLALSRFHSKHIALRESPQYVVEIYKKTCIVFLINDPFEILEIKAMEEGLFGERYSLAE